MCKLAESPRDKALIRPVSRESQVYQGSFVRKYLFLIACLSSWHWHGYAQIVNVERFRLDLDTANLWLGNAGLGLNIKKQQNNIYTYNGNLNAVFLSRRHAFISLNYFRLLRQDRTNLLKDGYAHVRVNLARQNRFSYEAFLQYQMDEGRGLYQREILGAATRLRLWAGKQGYMSANTGFMYEKENWHGDVLRFETDSGMSETVFIRSTSNVTARISLTEGVSLFLVTYYQARPDYFFRPRLISDIQIQLRINRYLAFNSQFVATLDAMPVVAGNTFVYTFNNSLLVSFNP